MDSAFLAVCEGNICRSPLAEAALKQFFRSRLPSISVSSAGLQALQDAPMDPQAVQAGEELGVASVAHRARQISKDIVQASGTVITMTRRQRDSVISRYPTAMKKTFTLLEYARLLELWNQRDMPEPLQNPAALARLRYAISLSSQDDVPDPYRKRDEVHRAAAAMIVSACSQIAKNYHPGPR